MLMKTWKILLGLVLVVAASGVHSQIYKWVDENGKIHYSDRKPPSQETEEITLKPTNVMEPTKALENDAERKQGDDEKLKKRRREEDALRDEARAWEQKNCSNRSIPVYAGGVAHNNRRAAGSRWVKVCDFTVPRAYQPYVTGHMSQSEYKSHF